MTWAKKAAGMSASAREEDLDLLAEAHLALAGCQACSAGGRRSAREHMIKRGLPPKFDRSGWATKHLARYVEPVVSGSGKGRKEGREAYDRWQAKRKAARRLTAT